MHTANEPHHVAGEVGGVVVDAAAALEAVRLVYTVLDSRHTALETKSPSRSAGL
jgi:hypothetical protein